MFPGGWSARWRSAQAHSWVHQNGVCACEPHVAPRLKPTLLLPHGLLASSDDGCLEYVGLQLFEGVCSLLDRLGAWPHLANGTADLREMAQIGLRLVLGYILLEDPQVSHGWVGVRQWQVWKAWGVAGRHPHPLPPPAARPGLCETALAAADRSAHAAGGGLLCALQAGGGAGAGAEHLHIRNDHRGQGALKCSCCSHRALLVAGTPGAHPARPCLWAAGAPVGTAFPAAHQRQPHLLRGLPGLLCHT